MASAWMPASAWWQSAAGVFLAGTTAFVANLALGSSVLTSAPAGMGVTTTELSVSFLRAATVRSQTIIGRGRVIQATRSVGLAEATLEDARGRLLGHSSSRSVLFRADPEILAARRLPEAPASDLAEPYLREVEGEVYSQEYWDTTPGLTVMQQLVGGAFLPPCFRFLGVRGVEAREGVMTMSMAASGWLCNGFGVVYTGAVAFLTTVLFTDIVGSTLQAAGLGDDRWRQVLAEHHAIVREQIRFRGREVDTAGDGFLIAFDGAARAVQCAMAVRQRCGHGMRHVLLRAFVGRRART